MTKPSWGPHTAAERVAKALVTEKPERVVTIVESVDPQWTVDLVVDGLRIGMRQCDNHFLGGPNVFDIQAGVHARRVHVTRTTRVDLNDIHAALEDQRHFLADKERHADALDAMLRIREQYPSLAIPHQTGGTINLDSPPEPGYGWRADLIGVEIDMHLPPEDAERLVALAVELREKKQKALEER